jgi:four helix bundle protein
MPRSSAAGHFTHKLQIVLKELRESLYWLRLASKSGLVPNQTLAPLMQEGKELASIIAKSVVTAKRKR